MGVHSLVTGLNGAGKTLYTVATKLRDVPKQTVEYQGENVKRRLVVGGIRDLLIEHDMMDVPKLDPETWRDEWADKIREPGTDAQEDVLCSIFNWWLWCKPGDVIVVDECQRVFRPMPSGKRVPMFIEKLETARHYGVEFIYLTQHPQLLHVNVRKLCGPHEDVRRIFGSNRVMVYMWDRVSNPDAIAKATSRYWKHDKAAFGLYKSAEMHGNFGQRLPFAVWALLGGLVLLAGLGYVLKDRLSTRFAPAPTEAAAAPASPSAATPAAARHPVATAAAAASSPPWPWYEAVPIKQDREPLAGRAINMEGGYSVSGQPHYTFGIVVDGERVARITGEQLASMGYYFTEHGPCVGVLRFGDRERLVTCPKPIQSQPQPAAAPSPDHRSPSDAQT